MKKEELNYYDEFITMSKFAVEISKDFKIMLTEFDYEQVHEKDKKIHEQEHLADKTQHKILSYLIKDFVPPIDRDDIIRLTRRLDDVIDNIDEVAIDIDILVVKELRSNIDKYIELLEVATNKMHELMTKFRDMKNYEEVKKICVAINGVEEQGDKLLQASLKELYNGSNEPIEVIKWTTIYNKFEDCFDSIEHIAECVDEIYMKNS